MSSFPNSANSSNKEMKPSTTNSKFKNKPTQMKRRNPTSIVSLTHFAHSKSKGTKKAIDTYRKKQQVKFNHKASLLRKYKKVMKQEGYEAGKGASRKRNERNNESFHDEQQDHADDHDDDDDIEQREQNYQDNNNEIPSLNRRDNNNPESKQRRRKKMDPFAKAKMKAEQKKVENENQKRELEERQRQREVNVKRRKIRSKEIMTDRTKKGQPIMKQVIHHMLEKIQSDISSK